MGRGSTPGQGQDYCDRSPPKAAREIRTALGILAMRSSMDHLMCTLVMVRFEIGMQTHLRKLVLVQGP
ncbi:MAG: hypothetical protein QG597_1280 [Actinomycetota bacterium]|nr:hypothetical protein [Actinomycetota bacterium]